MNEFQTCKSLDSLVVRGSVLAKINHAVVVKAMIFSCGSITTASDF